MLAMLDRAAEADDRRVGWEDLVARSGRSPDQVKSDLAHLTMIAKAVFGRQNWPTTVDWRAGVPTYLMDRPTAEAWRQIRQESEAPQMGSTETT